MLFREEVLNLEFAKILRAFGLTGNPEVITSPKLPDVTVVIGGLILIIEGRVNPQAQQLNNIAKKRLEDAIAQVSIALIYPPTLNNVENIDALKSTLLSSCYSGRIFYWSANGIENIEIKNHSIREIVDSINHIYTLYTQNDLLLKKIEEIDETLTNLTKNFAVPNEFFSNNKFIQDLKKALGVYESYGEKEET